MRRLIRGELLKLRTTQVWFWLLLASLVITVLAVIAQLAPHEGVRAPADVVSVLTSAGVADLAVFVLGVLGVTTEFRYQTITSTVLATPSRWALITAKLICYALVGVLYALLCVVATVAISWPWLSSKGINVWAGTYHAPQALGAVVITVTAFGLLGIGIGALLRNQVVAVTVGLIFFVVVTPVMIAIPGLKYAYPYTPGGAANALTVVIGSRDINGFELLPPLGGVLLLVGWALVPAIVGARLTMSRDIT